MRIFALILCLMCLFSAVAEGFHASGYSENYIQIAPDGTAYLRGDLFGKNMQLSRAALFQLDGNTATPAVSVFDEYADIVLDGDRIYAQKAAPYLRLSLLNNQPEYSWYDITDPAEPRLIHEYDGADREYIFSSGKVFYTLTEGETCQLWQVMDHGYTLIHSQPGDFFTAYDTLVLFNPNTANEDGYLHIYDIASERILKVPFGGATGPYTGHFTGELMGIFNDILVAGDAVFYTELAGPSAYFSYEYRLMRYDILTGEVTSVISDSRENNGLFCDGDALYILDQNYVLHTYSLAESAITGSIDLGAQINEAKKEINASLPYEDMAVTGGRLIFGTSDTYFTIDLDTLTVTPVTLELPWYDALVIDSFEFIFLALLLAGFTVIIIRDKRKKSCRK